MAVFKKFIILLSFGVFYYKSISKINFYSIFINKINFKKLLIYFILIWLFLMLYSILVVFKLDNFYLIFWLSYIFFALVSLSFSIFWWLAKLKSRFGHKYLILNKIAFLIYNKIGLNVELIVKAFQAFKSFEPIEKLNLAIYTFAFFFLLRFLYFGGIILSFFNIECQSITFFLENFRILSNLLLPCIFILALKPYNHFFFIRSKATGYTVYGYLYLLTYFWLIAFTIILIYNFLFCSFILLYGKIFIIQFEHKDCIFFIYKILKEQLKLFYYCLLELWIDL